VDISCRMVCSKLGVYAPEIQLYIQTWFPYSWRWSGGPWIWIPSRCAIVYWKYLISDNLNRISVYSLK
jgi:hypothetical protein